MIRSLIMWVSIAALCGCARGTALEVIVTVDGEAVASCVKLEASSRGEVFSTDGMLRKDSLAVAVVKSKALGNPVSLIARASVGVGCDEPQQLNLESEVLETTFDEGKVRTVTLALHAPGPEIDRDQDGYRAGVDCDDGRADVQPGAAESCGNGADDDCDGLTDCEQPACASVGPMERCDGKDNDCDGMSDEGFTVGYLCTAGSAACAREGLNVCARDGASVVCSQTADLALAVAEGCNGLDDDCDGVIDNGFPLGAICQVGTAGCARTGVVLCIADGGTGCSATIDQTKASRELCDGIDNDCDGVIDQAPQCGGPATDVAEVLQQWAVSEAVGDATEPCSELNRGLVSLTEELSLPWAITGARAVRVNYGPDGAGYFSGHYPTLRNGDWDLTTRTGLSLTISAQQPNTYGGWSPNGPTIVLCVRDGGYRQLDPIAPTLLPTDGGTIVLRVPLDGDAGWLVSGDGGIDLRSIDSFEVHLDPTRGAGTGMCTMWLDDVHFY